MSAEADRWHDAYRTMGYVDDQAVSDLRRLRAGGARPTEMIRQMHERGVPALKRLYAFMVAFNIGLADVTPVIGWRPDDTSSPEDREIDRALDDAIREAEIRVGMGRGMGEEGAL